MEFSFRWAGTQRVKLLIKPCPPSWGRFAPPGFAHAVSNLLSCKVRHWAVQGACSTDWPAAAYPCTARRGMRSQHYRAPSSLVEAVPGQPCLALGTQAWLWTVHEIRLCTPANAVQSAAGHHMRSG